ncbi:MAG: TetR/AcrR family transcriptional repressor of nem operon [Alphaproteobacteria bacterium]|jgi:TetR/AcrR family transcriptional repressor of nem operon
MSATVDKVLDAAEGAMRARGYHAVSFRELADDIGIKSSSVHYHFPQKDDLGVALIERYSKRVLAELNRRSEESKNPNDRLDAFIDVYREALVNTDSVCLCVMLGAESRGLPDNVSNAVADFFDANIGWLANILPTTLSKKARRNKAASVLATLQGAMMMAATLKDTGLFDAIVKELRAAHRQS